MTKLKPSTRYAFRVYASNDIGASEAGPAIEVTTKDPLPTVCTDLKAVVNKKGELTLSWTAPVSSIFWCAADGFHVQASHDGVDYTEVGKVQENSLVLSKKTVEKLMGDGVGLTFRVAGYCEHGMGPFSSLKWVNSAKEKAKVQEENARKQKEQDLAREQRQREEEQRQREREQRLREKEAKEASEDESEIVVKEHDIIKAIKPKVSKKPALPFKWKLALASVIPILVLFLLWVLIGQQDAKPQQQM